ncbi:hypothetical protein AGLY_000273 [Aphis glycines]|uniref:Transmembrane protein n=1 Tax=Aphis glycines TaxID=307491 RepID=A0A6G0U6I0_APHGL|nr:hypothetical protein AGLY_000273 [Aphis glycines]
MLNKTLQHNNAILGNTKQGFTSSKLSNDQQMQYTCPFCLSRVAILDLRSGSINCLAISSFYKFNMIHQSSFLYVTTNIVYKINSKQKSLIWNSIEYLQDRDCQQIPNNRNFQHLLPQFKLDILSEVFNVLILQLCIDLFCWYVVCVYTIYRKQKTQKRGQVGTALLYSRTLLFMIKLMENIVLHFQVLATYTNFL